ncbi:hypothetical protein BS78_K029900 [Paspalum vaginatum]|uniref:Uncharacterized protein n=1 Tax=Paspalum vaginatum TaxID=158149 RepID=A0A9W7X9H3_9POAL|nr:hypothetical protein BS78_K029900 [Paspalum vaginatum]
MCCFILLGLCSQLMPNQLTKSLVQSKDDEKKLLPKEEAVRWHALGSWSSSCKIRRCPRCKMKSVDCENRNILLCPQDVQWLNQQVVSSLSAIPHTDQGHEKIANYQYFLQYQRKKMLVDYSG